MGYGIALLGAAAAGGLSETLSAEIIGAAQPLFQPRLFHGFWSQVGSGPVCFALTTDA